ncbi:Crp/Fnr family transcriptional regulator [Halopseudomonas sp.]|jgi:CRP/FNR family transcriptional regulator|uniref:Crp/Fnr family transcriptional regulator n=1 Tax=Halopseudomonas sp. TaxID=2901191 RepID=UPI001A4F1152|nr:Crp/Fnr family transcriptional regulator [Pseudomonas sp.]|tara:strand:- start:4995 stop:5603 length:609 start_codon:yes stop_codon:yes gene_type:complete
MKHPVLEALPPLLRREAQSTLQVMPLPAGQIIFGPGDACQGLPLVLSGSVRVQMTGVSGNRIVLYRMGADDICTLSIGCLMSDRRYRAEAVVEADAEALMLPRELFDRMMAASAAFRASIMASYGRRLDDLMLLVEEVAFRRMDQRLEEWLSTRARQGEISVTHQEIAEELGTAREVISRLLKEMERQGRVTLSRGRIRCLD